MTTETTSKALQGVELLLGELPWHEQVAKIKAAFCHTAKGVTHREVLLHGSRIIDQCDELMHLWLSTLEQVYEQGPVHKDHFCTLLTNELYWELPGDIRYTISGVSNWAPFSKTKEWIWRKVINQWDPALKSDKNTSFFLFLVAAFDPLGKGNEPFYECKASGRHVTAYEQTQLLELIHQHVKYKPVFLEHWLSLPCIPTEIIKKLAHAWVNERGWRELPLLFARSAALGEANIEECSEEGTALLQEWSQLLMDFDREIRRLRRMLDNANSILREVEIDMQAYRYLLAGGDFHVLLRAEFTSHHTREETLAVFNQILAVVAEWSKGERGEFANGVFVHGRKMNVVVEVEGKGHFSSRG